MDVFTELIVFIRQLGLALAGASSLWTIVFVYKNLKGHGSERACIIYEWISRRLVVLIFAGGALALVGWGLLVNLTQAHAHEGIALKSTADFIAQGLAVSFEFYIVLIVVLAWGAWMYFRKSMSQRVLAIFSSAVLLLSIILMAFGMWVGEFTEMQWFFIGHSTHSIITLGTVLVLDVLFLISRNSQILKQHIYPLFPTLSKVILVGLGIDFLSVWLVFGDAIELTSKFFYMQTVVIVLVINGMLLAGPITRRLVTSVREGGTSMAGKWTRIANVAGAVSVSSWLGNTFIDSFSIVPFSYLQLIGFYIGLILVLLLAHKALEGYEAAHPYIVETSDM